MYHLQKHTAADGNRSCIPLSCTKLKPSKATDIFRAQVSSAGALKRFRAVCKINWLKKIQANGGGGGNPDHVPAESFSTVPVQPEVHKDLISKRKKKKKKHKKKEIPTHFLYRRSWDLAHPAQTRGCSFSPPCQAPQQLRSCSCSNNSLSVAGPGAGTVLGSSLPPLCRTGGSSKACRALPPVPFFKK